MVKKKTPKSTPKNVKYKTIFNNVPVAIIECDYSPLKKLAKHLKEHTVTNIRQFLSEHRNMAKQTFRHTKIIETNDEALRLFGVKTKKDLFASLDKAFSSSGIDVLVELFVNLLEGESDFDGEFRCSSAKGGYHDLALKIFVPPGNRESFARVIATLQDITMWKRLERQLRKRAQLDGLTKLINHNTIAQRLDLELIRAKRYGLSLSCLMIDLDHFKVVNDKFGHQRGDMVLKRVATMIKNCFRKVDVIGRYGGDEFLVILPETKAQNARYAANRVHRIFSNKIFNYQRILSINISLSIGIAGYPSKKIKTSKDMISFADKAMYSAKKAGRNRVVLA